MRGHERAMARGWVAVACAASALLGLGACGGPGAGAASADEALATLAEAARTRDAAKAAALFPTPEIVAAALDCPADSGLAARYSPDAVRRDIAKPLDDLGKAGAPTRDPTGDATEDVAAGAPVGDCAARRPLRLAKAGVAWPAAAGAAATSTTERLRFLVVDGRWYLLRL